MRGTMQEVPRAGRILRVLARHGFIGALRREREWPSPTHVREALEELGVVFLKFGQVLAMRRDLLSAEYVEELERLHDRLPLMSFDIVRQTVEASLGSSLTELFASFDAGPLAAATIAQVYRAALRDGRDVVVKVRRPGLEQRATEDCATLTYVAAMAERVEPRLRAVDLVGMVREFRESLRREMDLRLEGQTIRRFRAALAEESGVWIPDVIMERTTDAVLTLEHSPGERVDQYVAHHAGSGPALAQRIAAFVLHQVFETGLFQADPHPGNILNVIEVFRGEVERVALRRYAPARLFGEGRRFAREFERMLHEAPADLRRTLRRASGVAS